MTSVRFFTLSVLLLVGAACGTGDGTADTQPATTGPSTTSTTSTPSTSATTTTTVAPTSSQVSYVPDGSGCTPGEGDLPDGTWYGVVESADESGIEFDLACWYSGNDAELAAAEDGDEAPNGYYVRNTNPALRTVGVAADTNVVWYPNFGDPESEATISFEQWVVDAEARGLVLGVWIDVEDGVIVEIREQWVP